MKKKKKILTNELKVGDGVLILNIPHKGRKLPSAVGVVVSIWRHGLWPFEVKWKTSTKWKSEIFNRSELIPISTKATKQQIKAIKHLLS